ncbi:MAG: hypothetical protein ABGZ17_29190 [Planctomycetaceae bacterium]
MLSYTAVHCDNCGSPLDVPQSSSFVSCQHCGSGLAIHRTDTVVYTEQIEKLSRQTKQVENDVTQLQRRLDLEKVDREWDTERRRLGRFLGDPGVPEDPASDPDVTAIVVFCGCVFCLGIFLFCVGRTGLDVLGALAFISVSVFVIVSSMGVAHNYRRARDSYLQRRANLLGQDSSAEHSNTDATPSSLSENPAAGDDPSGVAWHKGTKGTPTFGNCRSANRGLSVVNSTTHPVYRSR